MENRIKYDPHSTQQSFNITVFDVSLSFLSIYHEQKVPVRFINIDWNLIPSAFIVNIRILLVSYVNEQKKKK